MNIGILGGSFDPPHIGHLLAIRQILELRPDIDMILLVPAYQHQWKQSVATPKDKVAMLHSFIQPRIDISEIELQRKGVSYAIDTIKAIKAETKASIYWIVGSDILREFHKWQKKEELTNEARFLVFPRDPYHLPKHIPAGFEVIQDKHLITTNISSTAIRNRIKQGKSIEYLVPREVEKYIISKRLYL